MHLLKRTAVESKMIKIAGQEFPTEMLPAELRKRWENAQMRAATATSSAARTKACAEIMKLTTEAAAELAPHALLRAAPRRSLFDLGK
jgi:hypothetical protein